MARLLRVQFEGAIYHVTLRGVERRNIFDNDRERERFLDRLAQDVETHGVRVYLYCLMANHVHLVLETPKANLSRFMHDLQTAYTVFYNRRHQRAGHLMQGRFGAQLVEGDEYLLKLSRYVHLNPVHVGSARALGLKERIAALRAYRWSSYRGYVGLGRPLEWMSETPVLAMMPGKASRRRREYRMFVEAGLAETDNAFLSALKDSPLGLGGEAFRERIQDLHLDLLHRHKRKEDVSFRRVGAQVPVQAVLDAVAQECGVDAVSLRRRQRGSFVRALASRMLLKHGGLTQREVAAILNLGTGAAISIQLRTLAAAAESSPRLRDLLARLDRRLEAQPRRKAQGTTR